MSNNDTHPPKCPCIYCKELRALPTLRERVVNLCKMRGWDMSPLVRMGGLACESAELCEAVRGKHGDTLEESADVLFCLLALSPHELPEIVAALEQKLMRLESAPPYKGEERTLTDKDYWRMGVEWNITAQTKGKRRVVQLMMFKDKKGKAFPCYIFEYYGSTPNEMIDAYKSMGYQWVGSYGYTQIEFERNS